MLDAGAAMCSQAAYIVKAKNYLIHLHSRCLHVGCNNWSALHMEAHLGPLHLKWYEMVKHELSSLDDWPIYYVHRVCGVTRQTKV